MWMCMGLVLVCECGQIKHTFVPTTHTHTYTQTHTYTDVPGTHIYVYAYAVHFYICMYGASAHNPQHCSDGFQGPQNSTRTPYSHKSGVF
jgi:hypothetical protein